MNKIIRRLTTCGGLISLVVLGFGSGCAANRALSAPSMQPLMTQSKTAKPAILKTNHFTRDRSGSISEAHLREVLAAPVFLEKQARVGVIQVTGQYLTDHELPLVDVPDRLCQAMEDSGLFEVSTEMSADWPADRGISGLRELAARYRSEYLLLYRHRFVDRQYVNGWGWTWLTVIGIFAAPSQTLEAAGVLEATLFDVKTGTILYTVFERVHGEENENIWHHERKRRSLKDKLLDEASKKLADQVVSKTRFLVAARPEAAQSIDTAILRP
ncbi:MAG: hypothetical protein JRF33_07960 [Deltaproteobacteria bacterium]|nr:hypothetical protein [Deltaproteobacteria bacterium]